MPHRRSWLLAGLVAAAALAPLATPAGADCGVPCGYVYPRLLLALGERGATYELTQASPLQLEGNLTFTWDITAEGMAVQNPTSPIVVTFSFPRKPEWLNITTDPPQLEIPISPQYMVPSADGGVVQVVYRYTTPLAVTARLTAPPTVDPELPPSLLILAQSSESGLYKPGFGVRDLPLALPEAIVQTAQRAPTEQLRIGEAAPLDLAPLTVAFQGATIMLEAEGPLELWKPATLVARVDGAAGPLAGLDMAASVVDERNQLLYTTGLRHREDGTLPFAFTFPEPGHFRVLVAARPLAVTDATFEPVVATFDVVLPGVGYDALRYPDVYRAAYAEPTSEFHANTQDLPQQFEKRLRFPVLGGADSASVQVQLGASAGAAVGAGSMYVEVLGPSGDELAYGKADAITPRVDARVRGPLPAGDYAVRLYGTAANPLGLGGSEVQVQIGVFYPEPPVGRVDARGAPRPMLGGPIALGTGGMELDLVLDAEPALWAPFLATLVAKTEDGAAALHPDFILSVRGPDGAILYTTGHRHPHDGLLAWGMAFPSPGLYTISAYAGPTPEASGAFWQPAIASWPILLAAPADGVVRYPATYEAMYHDSTSTLRSAEGYGYAFAKTYPVPVKEGAQGLEAELALSTMAMVQHVEGAAPAALTLHLLDPAGRILAEAQANAAGVASVAAPGPLEPGTYAVHVTGPGYAPLDYAGAMYALHIHAAYLEGPTETLAGATAPAPPAPARAPAPDALLVLVAVALLAVAAAGRSRKD